jgi:2-polyprenyl-6-methoxyphenol hydroxylase-like FAD-dependent oxidoreductase
VRIVIIGGGIGGLATAIALRQRGIASEVYEAATEIAAVGAGIMMSPNAMEVLSRLGLADDVRAQGFALNSGEMRDARDGLLQRIDLSAAGGRVDISTVAIHRARLQQILVSKIDPSSLHIGRRCSAVTAATDSAIVHFDDGAEVRADVVIGADGLRSVARGLVAPDVKLRYSGQTAYRGVAHITLVPEMVRSGGEIWGAGRRFGYGAIAYDEVYWFATRDALEGERTDAGRMREALGASFAGYPYPASTLIAATDESRIIRTDLYDFAPMKPWHRGRVVLIGDAAHATTPNLGQGGAQAIEDAWVLADQLSRSDDPSRAFEAYEAIRRPKATFVVNRSRQIGRMVHLSNPVARATRNFILRHTPPSAARRQLERLFTLNF